MKITKLSRLIVVLAFSLLAFDRIPVQAAVQTSTHSTRTSSSSKTLGLGVIFGEPTGLTLKYWNSHTTAINFGVTYSFGNYFVFLADYLWHFPTAFSSATRGKISSEFVPYVGIGAELFVGNSPYSSLNRRYFFFNSDNSIALGARIPLGIEFMPRSAPLGIFAEIVPGIGLVPGVFGFLQGGVGVRFYL